MACNSAIVHTTRNCLLPSRFFDPASDDIVFIMQSLTWPPECLKRQAILRRAVTLFCKDCIAGGIHPKVKLYI